MQLQPTNVRRPVVGDIVTTDVYGDLRPMRVYEKRDAGMFRCLMAVGPREFEVVMIAPPYADVQIYERASLRMEVNGGEV